MASVTTEKRNGKTLYRIEYRDKDKRRRKIRLGSLSKRDAQAIAVKVQNIVSAQVAENDLPPVTAEWLSKIGDDLHARLAEQGLCKPRVNYTLEGWLDNFIRSHEKKVSDHCLSNLGQAERLLEEHFGNDCVMRDITAEDAHEFRVWLEESDYAQATIAGHIKKAKQFFAAAVKAGVVKANVFETVSAGTQVNEERSVYVSTSGIDKAIAMAPDAQWRLLIALSRYGGLRCPSETLTLRWSDIDFEQGLMNITCSKTAKQGNSKRQTPIFPEVRPYLEDAFDPEHEFCITRYRETNSNLRTQFLRILEKAKVKPWPRLFHNMRGSRETDLLERFPVHVVMAWLGHSEKVALKHYLKVTPDHIERATAASGAEQAKPSAKVGQQVGTSLPETTSQGGNQQKPILDIPEESDKARFPDVVVAPRAGFEPATY